MTKVLAALMGMLAMLFATPALAQGVPSPAGLVELKEGDRILPVNASFEIAEEPPDTGGEVEATGYLSPVYSRDVYSHLLNDEMTGATYFARSEKVNFDSYDADQRVIVRGALVAVEGYPEPILEVTGVKFADDTPSDETATLTFELAVEGEPPADATFFGTVRGEGLRYVPLTDPDGDSVYTGSTTVSRFAPGTRPLPSDTEPVSLPVQMVQGTGTRSPAASDPPRPGEPIRVVEDFGAVRVEDETLSANASFEEVQGAFTTPDPDDDSYSGDGYVSGIRSLLPGTGGVVLALGVGALLVAGGFLVRRVTR